MPGGTMGRNLRHGPARPSCRASTAQLFSCWAGLRAQVFGPCSCQPIKHGPDLQLYQSYVTAGNFETHISEQYFKNSPTGYDLTTCNMVNPLSYFTSTAFPDSIDSLRPPFLQRSKQLLAPVRFGQGWSCYAINVPEKHTHSDGPFSQGGCWKHPHPMASDHSSESA